MCFAAHEVLKNKGDPKYALMWQDRTGFARLAIQHGLFTPGHMLGIRV